MVKNEILILDVETTGFDPMRHACIEVGAVLLDLNLQPISEFSSLIAPWPGAVIEGASMEVNKISVSLLRTAPAIADAIEKFTDTFGLHQRAPLIGGWNVSFDVMFLRTLYERAERKWPFSHRVLDVQSVVSFHSSLASVSQQEFIKRTFGEQQTHRALDDARHTGRILRLMAERYLV